MKSLLLLSLLALSVAVHPRSDLHKASTYSIMPQI